MRIFKKYFSSCFQIFGLCFSILCLSAFPVIEGAIIPIGAGGYTDSLPTGQKGPSDSGGNAVLPSVTPTMLKPPPTNDWWSSLIWKYNAGNQWSENLFAYPLSFKASAQGLGLAYMTQYGISPYVMTSSGYNSHEYHYNYVQDMRVGVAGLNSPNTSVDNYTDWTVTGYWSGNGKTLKAVMGRGLPFVYFTVAGGNAQIAISNTPTVWYNNNGVLGVTINGHHYGIFAPAGSTWSGTGTTTFSSFLNGKDYLTVAALPDNTLQTLEFYRQHAYAFVTNTQVSWNYDSATANLAVTYTVETTLKEAGNNNVNQTLMALFRHQWLNTNISFTPYTYVSPRGNLKVFNGNSFTTKQTFNGILPELPNVAIEGVDTYSPTQLYNYVNAIYTQTPTQRMNGIAVGDTYWTGKALGRLARLVHIADQVGHSAARDLFLSDLKARLQDWLDGQSAQLFYFDKNWKTLIGFPASYGSNTELNDHHFHWGYFIMAAATVAQYDKVWASPSNWGGMVELLIKDVGNWDRTDTRFPFLRQFDVYQGHCWANGPAQFAAGNNQESSSESMNFSSAVILWGAVTNNQAIRDLGIFLYAVETSAIEQYWFDIDDEVFPPGWNEPTLAINWGNGGAYAIWWNGRIEEVHGINFLPITGGSLYLGRNPEYLRINETFMQANGGTTNDWVDIHMAVRAFYDPLGQITFFNNNLNYASEAGETKAHTYHWIHNLNRLGTLNKTITADMPTYAVFDKNGDRTYVAFNPNAASTLINFSDGYQLQVPANTLTTSKNAGATSFVQGADDVDGGQINVWFQSTPPSSSVSITYSINNGPSQTVSLNQTVSNWQKLIAGFNTGDVVNYSFSYVQNGVAKQTDNYQHTYTIDHGYTQSASDLPGGETNINFQSNQPSTSVVLNYKINAGALQSASMVQSSSGWTFQVGNLKYGDVISYSFAYVQSGTTYTTTSYNTTYSLSSSNTFAQNAIAYAWGNAALIFTPNSAASNVIAHFKINGGLQQNVTMKNNNGSWNYVLIKLKDNDSITYSFTFTINGASTDTSEFQFIYLSSSLPPPPNGPYTQQVNQLTNGHASLIFVPTSPANWVILHYSINGGAFQNVQMANSSGNWNYLVNGIPDDALISYSYTYAINGVAADSTGYEYAYYLP